MPYIRVDPDLYLEHNGVEVFRTYRAGTSEPWEYWFTTNPDDADNEGAASHFDARLLAARWESTPNVVEWDEYWKPRFRTEDEAISALIRSAIERGSVNLTTGQREVG